MTLSDFYHLDEPSEIENLADHLLKELKELSHNKHNAALIEVSKYLQKSQKTRIGKQENPDGSSYVPRKPQKIDYENHRPIKFLYGAINNNYRTARVVYLRHWTMNDDHFFGFDGIAGKEDKFFKEKIVKKKNDSRWFLPETEEDFARNVGSGLKLSHVEVSKIMFQKLRMAKYLKKGIDNNDKLEMWTGFIGSAARIARINQFGLTEKWGKRTSHFPSRELLGFTAQDEENILAIIMKALDS